MYNVRRDFSPEARDLTGVAVAGLSKNGSASKDLSKVESAVSLTKSLGSRHLINKSLDSEQIKALSIAETLVPSPDGKKFSFGVGRSQMQPYFVDDIKTRAKKDVLSPGPHYEERRVLGRGSVKKTMGMRLSYDDRKAIFDKGNYPGPGSYRQPEIGMIDKFSAL